MEPTTLRTGSLLLWAACVPVLLMVGKAGGEPPGDTKIVWKSSRSGTDSIWIMNPDGSDKVQLTDNLGHDITPALSPDGSEIALASHRNGSLSRLFLMNHDGSNLHEIAAIPGLNVQYPSWSPDGQRIIFNAVAGSSSGGIYVVDRDGANLQQVTGPYKYDCRPFYSPDGETIWFDRRTSSASYSHQLFRMDSDGSNIEQCTSGGPSEDTTTFCGGPSPDGSMLTYSRGHSIWVAEAICPVEGILLFEGNYPTSVYELPSWSPDGQWIVFDYKAPGGDENIYICRTDGSDLTQLTFDAGSDQTARWGVSDASCPADLNDDGKVDISDIVIVLDHWGQNYVPADINGDGVVNIDDLFAVLAAWGPCR